MREKVEREGSFSEGLRRRGLVEGGQFYPTVASIMRK